MRNQLCLSRSRTYHRPSSSLVRLSVCGEGRSLCCACIATFWAVALRNHLKQTTAPAYLATNYSTAATHTDAPMLEVDHRLSAPQAIMEICPLCVVCLRLAQWLCCIPRGWQPLASHTTPLQILEFARRHLSSNHLMHHCCSARCEAAHHCSSPLTCQKHGEAGMRTTKAITPPTCILC